MSASTQIILFIIPDEQIRSALATALQRYENPYSYKVVATNQEARSILANRNVRCIVMTKAVALTGDDGKTDLMAAQSGLPPTITLLQRGDGFPDYLYKSDEFHDWCTMPFGLDELYDRLSRLLKRANQQHGEITQS